MGHTSFPIKDELRKLPMNVVIDDSSRICFPCLPKLKKRKSLEEKFVATTEVFILNYGKAIRGKESEPSCARTQRNQRNCRITLQTLTSMPRMCLPPQTTLQNKNAEFGAMVGYFLYLQYICYYLRLKIVKYFDYSTTFLIYFYSSMWTEIKKNAKYNSRVQK